MELSYLFSIDGKNFAVDLLSPLTISNLVVEITSRCNLRCTFCAKSEIHNDSLPGRNMDMPFDVVDKTITFLNDEKIPSISLVGVGEPTFRKDWIAVCEKLIRYTDARLVLVTNFGRKCEPDDLDCLLQFATIGISLESTDTDIQREIRRSVDLSTIVFNIITLRTRARVLGIKMPVLFANCTVTQRNAFGLKDLAAFCLELGLSQLNISSLYEFDSAKELGSLSIEDFTAEQLGCLNDEIAQAQQVLKGSHTGFAIQPRLSQLLKGQKEANWQAEGLTRICLQPWGSYTVGADGQVFPCCLVMDPYINIDKGRNNIINGEKIRLFRKMLLEGKLPEICKKCSNAPLGTKEELAKTVALRAFNEGLAFPWQAEGPTSK